MKKKILLLAALCCGIGHVAHGQFTFEGAYTSDACHNFRGGMAQGGGFMGLAGIAVGLDTGAAGLWRGGTFYVHGAGIHGHSLSAHYTGDLQVASNIDADETVSLYELWFRQRFGRVTVTAGLQDLNAEFMVTGGGGEFINSSLGTPSVIALGVPGAPVYPDTRPGVEVRWDVSDRWAVQGALYEGGLAMGEVHLDGRFKFGGYYHSASRVWGIHASVDQPVGERVGLFAQAALSPRDRVDNNIYLSLGANFHGVFSRHRRDAAGVAIAHAGLHSLPGRHETAVELYYRYNFTDNIALQPDVQYIVNPSGTGAALPDALVGILRLAVAF